MKKILNFLILCFIFPAIVSADITTNEEFINELGGPEYAQLINNKITLKKDIYLNRQLHTTEGTYTLDLNGNNIFNDKSNPIASYLLFFENSTLTIEDSKEKGVINITEGGIVILSKNSNLTIKNIKMNTNETPIFFNGGTGKIIGGEYISSSSDALYATSSIIELEDAKFIGYSTGANFQDATITISNCEITSTLNSSIEGSGIQSGGGKLTINSGIFSGSIAGLKNYSSNLILNGGTYIANYEGEQHPTDPLPGGIVFLSENELANDVISKTINELYILSNNNITRGRISNLNTVSTEKKVSIIKKQETITYSLKNITSSSANKYYTLQDVIINIQPNDKYILPEKIIIKIFNEEITNYTYDQSTGTITIPKEEAKGPIEVIVTAIKEQTEEETIVPSNPSAKDENTEIENPNTSDYKSITLIIHSVILLILIIVYKVRQYKLKDLM